MLHGKIKSAKKTALILEAIVLTCISAVAYGYFNNNPSIIHPGLPAAAESLQTALEGKKFSDAVAAAGRSGKKILVTFRSERNRSDSLLSGIFASNEAIGNYLYEHFVLVDIDQSFESYKRQKLPDLLSTKMARHAADPSIVFFDEKGDLIWFFLGTFDPKVVYAALVYTSGKYHLKQSFADYYDDRKKQSKNLPIVKWHSFNEGIEIAKATGKKMLINAHAYWSPYCIMMKNQTYSDSSIISYIKSNFVPIQIEDQPDNIPYFEFSGKKIGSYELLTKIFEVKGFPETVFCEPDGKKIDIVSGFAKPDVFLNVLKYFKEEKYKSENIGSYMERMGMKDVLK